MYPGLILRQEQQHPLQGHNYHTKIAEAVWDFGYRQISQEMRKIRDEKTRDMDNFDVKVFQYSDWIKSNRAVIG